MRPLWVKRGPLVDRQPDLLNHFAEADPNELFAYFGSAGLLELAVPRQSAARLVEARRGIHCRRQLDGARDNVLRGVHRAP